MCEFAHAQDYGILSHFQIFKFQNCQINITCAHAAISSAFTKNNRHRS